MNAILQKLRENKERLFKKYPLKSMALFGSRAREDYREDSDVDVLVEFSKPVGMEFIRLAHELEDMFNYKVDLVSKKRSEVSLFESNRKRSAVCLKEQMIDDYFGVEVETVWHIIKNDLPLLKQQLQSIEFPSTD